MNIFTRLVNLFKKVNEEEERSHYTEDLTPQPHPTPDDKEIIIPQLINLKEEKTMNPKHIKVSKECTDMVAFFEGFSEKAYQDVVGVWTIGHGFTKNVKAGDTITYEESLERLNVELQEHADIIPSAVKVDLTQNEYDALASFIFNLGGPNFTRSTLLRKINKGDKQGASLEFKRWNRAGGKEFLGLTRRRYAEKLMFLGENWEKYDDEIRKS